MANMVMRPKYDEFMVKVNVQPGSEESYYVDRRTGVSQWERPKLLGSHIGQYIAEYSILKHIKEVFLFF